MSINQTQTTLQTNQYGVFYIRFRVSVSLLPYFNKEYIVKTLGTKELKEAKTKADYYRSKYLEIVKVADYLEPTNIQQLVDKYNKDVLKQTKGDTYSLSKKVKPSAFTMAKAFKTFDKWYKKTNVQSKQYKIVCSRIETAINFFGSDKDITELTTDDIEEYIDFLSEYPKPSKKPYCNLSFNEIVELKEIPKEDMISTSTLIKYIKAFRQMENYLVDDGKLNRKISKRANLPTATTVKTKEFTTDDLEVLFNQFDNLGAEKLIYYTYAYTGMRSSEFWKCRIGVEEGVYMFDLSYDGVELKTASSHRKIPIHSKLLDMGIVQSLKQLQKKYKQTTISQNFNGSIINSIEDTTNKFMYGFRHTVASRLKALDVDMDKVSEILGHTYENNTITKSVYASKYPIKVLKEAIDKL